MAALFSKDILRQLLGIDLRTLALVRIGLAIAVMAQAMSVWPDAFAIFDDRGVYPAALAVSSRSHYLWSLYYVSGNVVWAHALLILTMLAALALLFGYRTRLAVTACWLLSVSLTTRISIFTSGGDTQLALLLFWAMFLPLGARFSVDAALCRLPKSENAYAAPATLAMLLQVAYLYFFGALLKTGASWQETQNAVYYAIGTVDINTPLSAFLLQFPELMRWLTAYVYHLELYAAFLIFSPFKNAWCRLVILSMLIALHIGFALFLSIGIFPLVSICGLLVFLPGLFWDRLLPWFNARQKRRGITLYYDEACAFCRKTCLIFRELGLPLETRIEPAQSHPGIHARMQQDNSWVVEDGKGLLRTRWDAVAWVFRRSPLLWPVGLLFLPGFMRPLGDRLYRLVADHRGGFGTLSARLLPEHETPPAFRPRRITQIAVIFLMLLVLAWNIRGLPDVKLPFPEPLRATLMTLKLTQKWRLFAPNSHRSALWVVIEGVGQNGGVSDLLRALPEPPLHAAPAHGYDAYPGYRWRKYFSRVKSRRYGAAIGRYFCAAAEEEGAPLKEVAMTAYLQKTAPPGADPLPTQQQWAFVYDCQARKLRRDSDKGSGGK